MCVGNYYYSECLTFRTLNLSVLRRSSLSLSLLLLFFKSLYRHQQHLLYLYISSFHHGSCTFHSSTSCCCCISIRNTCSTCWYVILIWMMLSWLMNYILFLMMYFLVFGCYDEVSIASPLPPLLYSSFCFVVDTFVSCLGYSSLVILVFSCISGSISFRGRQQSFQSFDACCVDEEQHS